MINYEKDVSCDSTITEHKFASREPLRNHCQEDFSMTARKSFRWHSEISIHTWCRALAVVEFNKG